MPRWNLDTDIHWSRFDRSKLDPEILKLTKAAALTEYNAATYTAYLVNVFKDDPEFQNFIHQWQEEEEQHGKALGRYARLADPSFDFDDVFKRFTDGYQIPVEVESSVRGSRVGEMVSRCVVETGTSSYYSAIREATDEPVLQEICGHIASDEFRHYKLFLDTMRKYLEIEPVSKVSRIRVAIGRMRETNDDELAFAFHCANEPAGVPYDREKCSVAYSSRAFRLYQQHHVERGTGMLLKAAGLKPQGWIGRQAARIAWWKLQGKADRAISGFA